jgi:3-oxoacyl-[acyl-carrier-protein] synthase III
MDQRVAHTEMRRDSLALSHRCGPDLEDAYVRCICAAVNELLHEARMEMDQIDTIMPPQISSRFISRLTTSLAVEPDRMVDATSGRKDLFTSSLAHGLAEARRRKMDQAGRVGLFISVGAGVEVGCALYWF